MKSMREDAGKTLGRAPLLFSSQAGKQRKKERERERESVREKGSENSALFVASVDNVASRSLRRRRRCRN